MRNFGSFFVAVCMAAIAASAGAALHFAADVPVVEASLIALALLFALLVLEVSTARRRDRAEFAQRCEGLAHGSGDIAREVGELRHRVAALAAATAQAPDLKAAIDPLAREIGELAQVVQDLAESVAVHDALLAEGAGVVPGPRRAVPAEVVEEPNTKAAAPAIAVPGGPFGGPDEAEQTRLVREAVEAGRLEIFLQPVVTLPQRKVRYYEALSRMRLVDGAVVEAAKFIPAARAAGMLPLIDERVVHACVQVVRRLAAKNREIGLFLNIAPETLVDRDVFPEILGYLDDNRALAPSLVLEMSQAVYRALGAAEHNSLSQLSERGFRFSLDRIEDFRIDPRGLADRGVRFVKVPAKLLLGPSEPSGTHIDPADLADLLGRHGIDLVADHIESETLVVDLLDYDVPYGQGFLFSPPRPVRADVLQNERTADPAAQGAPAEVADPAGPAASPKRARVVRTV